MRLQIYKERNEVGPLASYEATPIKLCLDILGDVPKSEFYNNYRDRLAIRLGNVAVAKNAP